LEQLKRLRLAKAHSKSDSLRITVPQSIVNQGNLKEGDKLDWSWEVCNNEMFVAIRRVGQTDNILSDGKGKGKRKK
jgi:hypothetical protein